MKTIFLLMFSTWLIIIGAQAPAAWALKKQYAVSGKTMGTYYRIKFIAKDDIPRSIWQKRVDTRLRNVNRKLSMYDPKSELSDFNRQPTQTPVKISNDFFTIIKTAQKIHSLTNGAWDGTIKPLVDLWGFGINKNKHNIPSPDSIQNALSRTGFSHIQITEERQVKKNRQVTLDLGSIAKGYGVDAIADLFVSLGVSNFLVEIGGELYASGKNFKKKDWSVGITRPEKKYINQNLYAAVYLKNQGIATSGNYRNFFEIKGKTYSHIINPETGYPVDNMIVSASVVAKNCTFADGLATALMVMDLQKGIDLVNSLEGTECLILQRVNGNLLQHESKNFKTLLVNGIGKKKQTK